MPVLRRLTLNDAEKEVLILLARGLTIKQVARERQRSNSAIRANLAMIYRILGCPPTPTAAVVRAIRLGMITLNEM